MKTKRYHEFNHDSPVIGAKSDSQNAWDHGRNGDYECCMWLNNR